MPSRSYSAPKPSFSGVNPSTRSFTGTPSATAQRQEDVGVRGVNRIVAQAIDVPTDDDTAQGFHIYANGEVLTFNYIEMVEITAPAAPATNHARLYLVDVAGKSALQVIFATGVAQTIAVEL